MLLELNQRLEVMHDLLQDSKAWQGIIIDRRKPITHRVFQQIGDNRLCLHKFEQFDATSEESFSHSHPWPGAFHILQGGYRMGVGKLDSTDKFSAGTTVATFDLMAGSSYEMIHPLGFHRVQPITPEVYTVMLNGPPWPSGTVHDGVRTTKGKNLREMTREEVQAQLDFFKTFFPTPARTPLS